MKRSFSLLCIAGLLILSDSCSTVFTGSAHRGAEIHIAGSSRGFRESPRVRRAKKQQAARERKHDKEWAKFVAETKKLHYERQSDKVKARMKRNEAETTLRHKEKARKIKKDSRARAKKFR